MGAARVRRSTRIRAECGTPYRAEYSARRLLRQIPQPETRAIIPSLPAEYRFLLFPGIAGMHVKQGGVWTSTLGCSGTKVPQCMILGCEKVTCNFLQRTVWIVGPMEIGAADRHRDQKCMHSAISHPTILVADGLVSCSTAHCSSANELRGN